ncbi:hypothetical protein FIE12Z_8075 [Fusarium flagelliforme]|uniref:Transcription factor domain-containing protein n=2 Tax=Fusarium flagelliforme TaxID=2675880 RepID=A0A395MIJ3_9HYPO|nr:hypothetical protein FIE12Z_8075 [Fusarium flagelliforme]
MVEMQASIKNLTSQLDQRNAACSADSQSLDQRSEVLITPENSQSQSLKGSSISKYESQSPTAQLDSILEDLIPNRATLERILEYTGGQLHQSWMLQPFSTINIFDNGFLVGSTEKAILFIHEALQSRDVGLVSKCLSWLCLCLSELPKDFRDIETGLPLCPEELINRLLTQISIFYLADCTPACSINSIEALVLQYELFIAIGRPSRAWKCVRAGIDNAMLLGIHTRQSNLYGGLWESLWIRDRQISLILGLPYTTADNFALNTEMDTDPELDALRRIASISGCISDRDRLRQDTSFGTMRRIVEEIKQLKVLIPDERNDSVFTQPVAYSILRLFKHTLNTMIHLPYSQFAGYDKQFEYTRVEVLESAEGAIRAHQDMREMQDTPAKCHLYDFLAFNAAVILITDLAAKETPRSTEEEERIWTVITELVSRLRKTSELLVSETAEQAAEVLENLHRACKGIYRGHEFHKQIPLLGKIQISRATEQHEDVEASTTTVLLETNTYTFRVPDEHLTEKELADDWSAQVTFEMSYGWRGTYEFPDN